MEKKRGFKNVTAIICILGLLILGGCGAKQSNNGTNGHGDRKVGCDS